MLRDNGPAAKPDIKRVIDKILSEDANFDRYENRSTHRNHLVRAVQVDFRETQETIHAFSRNISDSGIGVITHEQVKEDSVALLTIASIDGKDTQILAECRWCKPFGERWFLSGWQFISLKRR